MHGNSRHFAFDEHFSGQGYSGRSYSESISRSSSEHSNFGSRSPSSSYSSHHGSFPYKPKKDWPNDPVVTGLESCSISSYNASLRSTDLREHSLFSSSTDLDVWPSQFSALSSDLNPPWNNTMRLPGIDSFEIKPIIHDDQHYLHLPSMVSGSLASFPAPPSQIPALDNPHKPKQRPKTNNSNNTSNLKMCSHCHTTSTPLWRREPSTLRTLCNACALYLQQHHKLRPQELIDADLDNDDDSTQRDATGPQCSHCHTRNTSVWRRSKTGAQLCNACGVYVRLRGRDRPLSLKRNKIRPRTKLNKSADK